MLHWVPRTRLLFCQSVAIMCHRSDTSVRVDSPFNTNFIEFDWFTELLANFVEIWTNQFTKKSANYSNLKKFTPKVVESALNQTVNLKCGNCKPKIPETVLVSMTTDVRELPLQTSPTVDDGSIKARWPINGLETNAGVINGFVYLPGTLEMISVFCFNWKTSSWTLETKWSYRCKSRRISANKCANYCNVMLLFYTNR